MELLLTGTPIDAATALDWGLVNRVVPAEQLDAEVDSLARAILPRSGPVITNGKRTFYAQLDQPLDGAYAVAADAMVRDLSAPDAAEGIDAFLGKREPRWPSSG
jgi:enoyl-CoA hydratase/carnithine racemase